MDNSDNQTRVMFITGDSRGIGRFLVEYYLDKGFVVYGCSRNCSGLEHPQYYAHSASVSDEGMIKEIFSEIRRRHGRLDVMINNSGVASMNHSILTTIDTVKAILDTNVIGTFICSREAAKLMRKHSRGRIINMTTFAVPFKLEGEAIYAASKSAVETLTEILAREYAPWGITVNAVAPPAVKTDLIKGVDDNKLSLLLKRQAIHEYGEPIDVARTMDYFIQAESKFITGQIIYMGGV